MPELESKSFQKRQVAYKVRISDLINNPLSRDDFSVGYIKINNLNIYRVNIVATLVFKSEMGLNYSSVIIDDGTGKILVRSFENNEIFSKVEVGDIVLAIGKIREFNNERYIILEIIKKINNYEWVNVRKLELNACNIESLVEIKNNEEPDKNKTSGVYEEIYLLIKNFDNGDGASVDDVIRNSPLIDTESIINRLLENGQIFQIMPGKLKVLE